MSASTCAKCCDKVDAYSNMYYILCTIYYLRPSIPQGPHGFLDVRRPPTQSGLPSFGTSSQSGGATENVSDASDCAEGGSLAFWRNGIGRRSMRRQSTSSSLMHSANHVGRHLYTQYVHKMRWFCVLLIKHQLFRPMYRGQAPTISRNLFNVMFVLRSVTLHFTVPIVETEDSAKMARVFYYLTQNYSCLPMIRFLCAVRELIRTTAIVLTHY